MAARRSSPSSTRCTSVPPCGAIVVVSAFTNSPLPFHGERVEPAFGLAAAAPPPRALRFAGRGGPGARPATDARVALVEEGVVRDAVFADVAPHVGPAPSRQGKHLDDRPAADLVVLDQLGGPPGVGLVLPHRTDPGVESDDGALQRLDFSNEAAAVRVGLVEWTRIGERRELHQIETIPPGEAPLELVRLAEVEPRVQEDHGHGGVDPAE